MSKGAKILAWVIGVPVVLFFGSAILAGISESNAKRAMAQTQVIPVTETLGEGKAYERYALINSLHEADWDAVKARLGKPDRTQIQGVDEYWYYSNKTWDYQAQKLDPGMQVVFRLGRVKDINFY